MGKANVFTGASRDNSALYFYLKDDVTVLQKKDLLGKRQFGFNVKSYLNYGDLIFFWKLRPIPSVNPRSSHLFSLRFYQGGMRLRKQRFFKKKVNIKGPKHFLFFIG